MAIDKGNSDTMNSLGNYYYEQKDYENMKKYYWMAIEKDNLDAVRNLKIYCGKNSDHNEMKKYYVAKNDIKLFNEGVFTGEKLFWIACKTTY